jgi:plasmid stability protein
MQAGAIVECMQYTIRNVSPELDRALKARAKELGKSVNQVALEALAQGVGQPVRRRNLRQMPGAWSRRDAAELDAFLTRHRKIDEELWR